VAVEDCDPLLKELHRLQTDLWPAALEYLEPGRRLSEVQRDFESLVARSAPREGPLTGVVATLEMRGLGLGADGPWIRDGLVDPEAAGRPLAPVWVFSFSPGVSLSTPRWRYTASSSDAVLMTEAGAVRLGRRPIGLVATTRP